MKTTKTLDKEMPSLSMLVAQGEHQFLEFKAKLNHPEKVAKEIIAFANTSGGTLLIGVHDNHEIVGVVHAQEDIFALNRVLKKKVWPTLHYTTESIWLNSKRVVIKYEIPQSSSKMHLLKEGKFRNAYIRVNDKSIRASKAAFVIFKYQQRNRGKAISIGEQEQKILQFFKQNKRGSTEQIQSWVSENAPETVLNTLIDLALSNILRFSPGEKTDFFYFNAAYSD